MSDLEAISEQFGRNLAEARGWAELSQTQLAEQVAVSQMDISLLERGLQCPRLDVVVALAGAGGAGAGSALWDRVGRGWPGERIHLQRANMALALEVYPHWRTIPELAREIGHRGVDAGGPGPDRDGLARKPRLGRPAHQTHRPPGAAEAPVTPSLAATL